MPPLEVMLILPAFCPAVPVEVMLPAAELVIAAPDSVIPPCRDTSAAFTASVPAPEWSASACMFRAPLPATVTVAPALTVMLLLACKVRLTLAAPPVAVARLKAFASVMLLVACSTTLLPAATPAKLPPALTLNTLFRPASSVKACVTSAGGVNPVVFVSTPVDSVMLAGSNSTVPPWPFADPASTWPRKSR